MWNVNLLVPCCVDAGLRRDLRLLFETLQAISMEMCDLSGRFEQELSTNHNLEAVARQLVDAVILSHK